MFSTFSNTGYYAIYIYKPRSMYH